MSTSKSPYQALREGKRLPLSELIPLPAPLAIYVETTNICNFKCKYCPESVENYQEIAGGLFQMSLDDFTRVAEQIQNLGHLKTLNLYMLGEPFVNKNLTQFARIARDRNIADRIIVTTNGTLLEKTGYANICDSGIDFLRVSIYGANPASHASCTQSTIPLQRVINNVAGLFNHKQTHSRAKPHLYIKMIDALDAAENAEFLQKFTPICDEIAIEPVMNWNDPTGIDFSGQSSRALSAPQAKQVCPFPFYTLVIHADLRVSVCCVDWDKKVVVGDLKTETLTQVWQGEKLRSLRNLHLAGQRHTIDGCKNCQYLHTAPDNIDSLLGQTI